MRTLCGALVFLAWFPAYASVQADHSQVRAPIWLQETTTRSREDAWADLRDRILADESNRIDNEFHVPPALKSRVAFWFDIYTRYGTNQHVIHHERYPWIIYKVVDTNALITLGKGPLWLRRQRADRLVDAELTKIKQTLRKLSHRRSFRHLHGLELTLYRKLQSVHGPRRRVFRLAANAIRSQLGQRDFFKKGLINSSKYLPYMEKTFTKAGLPIGLTRMPFVESSFNEAAYSKVGASGIWQIMPKTGKAHMIVTHAIDERNSPLKATRAAAKILRRYHRALKSWPLAITAYNHGIGNIRKAIRRAHSKNLATIIARYHRDDFQFASANFYTCFLAALHAERYHELLFNDVVREPLQKALTLKLKRRTSISTIERLTRISADKILEYNLDLKATMKHHHPVLPKGFELRLPPTVTSQARKLGTYRVNLVSQTNI